MGKVDDEDAEDNADKRGDPVCSAKDNAVEKIEPVPQATPNKDKPQCDTHVIP